MKILRKISKICKCKSIEWKMILLFLATFLFVAYCIVMNAGISGFSRFSDFAVFFCLAGLTILMILWSGVGKNVWNGFRLSFTKRENVSRMEIESAVSALRFLQKAVFLEAVLCTTIGFLNLLYNMDDPATLGPALANCILSLFYASFFALLLEFPMGRLSCSLIGYMAEPADEASAPEAQTIYFKLRGMGLTDREAEVARLVSCEMSNKEISQMLYISDSTVKKHITHILEKTGQPDRDKLTEMIKNLT